MALDIEQAKRYYQSANALEESIRNNLHMYLKNDYSDKELLALLQIMVSFIMSKRRNLICLYADDNFDEAYRNMLLKTGRAEIIENFNRAFREANIDYVDGLDYSESKTRIVKDVNGELQYQIKFPNVLISTNLSYAALAHELTHFVLYRNSKKWTSIEYSEAMSFFFEYLMYLESTKDGEFYFLNNRLYGLGYEGKSFRDDLKYAQNPQILGIDEQCYVGPIAAAACYYDSLEYTLGLIEREKTDPKDVYSSVGKIITGESTCEKEAHRLDIDTSSYKRLRKVIKC